MSGPGKNTAVANVLTTKNDGKAKKKPATPLDPNSVAARTLARKRAAQGGGGGRLSTILSETLG
jgi:hypothetical protein